MTDQELSKQAKGYFAQISKVDRLIQRLTNTVSSLRARVESPGNGLSQSEGRSSGPKDIVGETVAQIVDLEQDIHLRIAELAALRRVALTKIGAIPDLDQQNVLIARYIQDMKWEAIAFELGRDIRWVYRVHGKALLQFVSASDTI